VDILAREVPQDTAQSVQPASVDQGYTGQNFRADAHPHGITLQVVKLPEVKRDLVFLRRFWMVECSFA